MRALIEFPVISRDSFRDSRKMAGEAKQHAQSLVDVNFNFPSEAVVQILEEKLSRAIKAKWEETLNRVQFPSIEQFTEFLYPMARR